MRRIGVFLIALVLAPYPATNTRHVGSYVVYSVYPGYPFKAIIIDYTGDTLKVKFDRGIVSRIYTYERLGGFFLNDSGPAPFFLATGYRRLIKVLAVHAAGLEYLGSTKHNVKIDNVERSVDVIGFRYADENETVEFRLAYEYGFVTYVNVTKSGVNIIITAKEAYGVSKVGTLYNPRIAVILIVLLIALVIYRKKLRKKRSLFSGEGSLRHHYGRSVGEHIMPYRLGSDAYFL